MRSFTAALHHDNGDANRSSLLFTTSPDIFDQNLVCENFHKNSYIHFDKLKITSSAATQLTHNIIQLRKTMHNVINGTIVKQKVQQ